MILTNIIFREIEGEKGEKPISKWLLLSKIVLCTLPIQIDTTLWKINIFSEQYNIISSLKNLCI